MKYNVHGSVSIVVIVTVEAGSEEEAKECAYQEFDGLTNFAGNGGIDKLVGTRNKHVSLDAGFSEPEFTEAELVTE